MFVIFKKQTQSSAINFAEDFSFIIYIQKNKQRRLKL